MAPMFRTHARKMGAAVFAATVLLVFGSASAREWIAFSAAPSAKVDAADADASSALELRGQLFRPAGSGRFPAVVMLHDCRGIRPFQVGWGDKLAGWGYVALIVDSFMTRRDADVCAHLPAYAGENRVNDRLRDAYGALHYLAAQPFVDPERILVMGWAYDAVLRSISDADGVAATLAEFKAAIAISPACGTVFGRRIRAPLLIFAGDRDDWTPAADCERLAAQRGNEDHVELVIYPGAGHGFDDPDMDEPLILATAWNPNRSDQRGAELEYQQAAHVDAIGRVRDFLVRHAPSSWDPAYAIARESEANSRAAWAVNPYQPGVDLPAVGRSAFDQLFSVVRNGAAEYELPFPFEALTRRIRERLPPDQYGVAGLKQTLIPLGRSLQRHAAAPDYFRFPRVVAAVDVEPEEALGHDQMLLKDRLFLGYQEKTNIIEVISYNELAGRFEFQLVKNYGPGLKPEVIYANRAICTSCHQNGGPMFALFPWDETNGNEGVAARLAQVRPSFYGVLVEASSAPAPSIDSATDRANLFPVYRRLWVEGCGEKADKRSTRCRAQAFVAMLQYRLSGSLHFDRASEDFREGFLSVAAGEWERRWPFGLKVPNPDIRNREPVFAHPDIPAIFDPLNLRPPLAVWSGRRQSDVEQVVTGLSEFVPAADLRRLDHHLASQRASDKVGLDAVESRCHARRLASAGPVTRLELRCRESFELDGRFRFRHTRLLDGAIDRLVFAGGPGFLQIAVNRGELKRGQGGDLATLIPEQIRSGMSVRLPDGRALSRIHFRLDDSGDSSGESLNATVSLMVADDFALVTAAVASLTRRTMGNPNGPFAPAAFRGTRAMQALFASLGLTPTDWCCDEHRKLPPARAESELNIANVSGLDDVRRSAEMRVFHRYCAGCHRTDNPVPPNFLSGDPATVEARLRQCAPRILYRLSMWSLDVDARAVTPMPPAAALAAHGIDDAAWRDSAELKTLLDYSRRMYESEIPDGTAAALTSRDYAKLRVCAGG